MTVPTTFLLAITLVFSSATLALTEWEAAQVDSVIDAEGHWIPPDRIAAIKEIGPDVVPHILDRYSSADSKEKAKLAGMLWTLDWKSEEAAQVLLADAKTPHQTLRVNVQYALGHLSDNPVVVQTLLDNMRNDDSPYLRDKAACALAYNQVHLDMEQKYYLFRGLIAGLNDHQAQVRKISIQALKIQTGQTKGFSAQADPHKRSEAIEKWHVWLQEYQRNL